ncbi:MAG: hypothetical protein JW812_00390 [Alphaproteobacteria bacterium]|nr:hypothetical protein [Alphaproteobacteria bacterium]MBN2779627.1 hypothetical protein [Alphaproteobacteria bacterium]
MTDALSLPENITLRDSQDYIHRICKSRAFNVSDPILEMLFLTEEIGELARVIRRTDPRGHADAHKKKT